MSVTEQELIDYQFEEEQSNLDKVKKVYPRSKLLSDPLYRSYKNKIYYDKNKSKILQHQRDLNAKAKINRVPKKRTQKKKDSPEMKEYLKGLKQANWLVDWMTDDAKENMIKLRDDLIKSKPN